MAEAVPYPQLLSVMEMRSSHRHDLPEARGDVGKEPPARQVEIGGVSTTPREEMK
jgi:hypothetical protein